MKKKGFEDCKLLQVYEKRLRKSGRTDIITRQMFDSKSCKICKYKKECNERLFSIFFDIKTD